MQKVRIKHVFEKYLNENNVPFEKDFLIKGDFVDYKIEVNEKTCLVKVKSNRSDIFATIGQLVNARRTCSYIFLLAPARFINKMKKIQDETKILDGLGFFEVYNGEVKIIKVPEGEHYFNENNLKKMKKIRSKHLLINEFDVAVLNTFEGQCFFISDVAKDQNVSLGIAYKRLNRLKRARLIEEVGDWYPKSFRVVRKCKVGEQIEVR